MSTDPSRRDFSLESVRRDSYSFHAARAYRSIGVKSGIVCALVAGAGYVLLRVTDAVDPLREASWLRVILVWAGNYAVMFGIACGFMMLLTGEFYRLRAISPSLGDRAHTPRLRLVLWLAVACAFLAFLLLIPMCFGSLQAGTYDCKTLPQWLFG